MDFKVMGKSIRQPALIKLICLTLFLFIATCGLWIRPNLFGVDSYATLSFIRFGWGETLFNQPIANFVFNLLPDSLLLFKSIMFLSIVAAIVPIFLLVKRFYGERSAWITIFLLMSLSPIVLFSFGEFENEIFAYPLISWAIYFFLTKQYGKSLIFMAEALLFWKWVFYLVSLSTQQTTIVERQLFAGLINFWALIPFIFFIPLIKNLKIRVFGVLALVCVLINAKLFILLLPFIALAIPNALDFLEKHINLRYSLYIIAFFGLFGWNIAFFLQQPTQNDLVFVSDSVKLARDTNLPLFNDWSFGYWIQAQGYYATNNPGAGREINFDKPGVYLTELDSNCNLIKKEKAIGRKQIAIFQCP